MSYQSLSEKFKDLPLAELIAIRDAASHAYSDACNVQGDAKRYDGTSRNVDWTINVINDNYPVMEAAMIAINNRMIGYIKEGQSI